MYTWLTRKMTLMAVMAAAVTRVYAVDATVFVAPTEVWEARAPHPSCPTTCSIGLGSFAEFGEGLAALREFAAREHPGDSLMPYTGQLARVPFNPGEYDADGDGRDDRVGYTHRYTAAFAVRRECTAYLAEGIARGWHGFLNGGPIALYEKTPATALASIAAQAYLRGAPRCARQPHGVEIQRAELPVFELHRASGTACPRGSGLTTLLRAGRGCRATGAIVPERNLGAQCPALSNGSNPINAVTGNKYQRETDYPGTVRGFLRFERHYNSQSAVAGAFGARWSHSYERGLLQTCVSQLTERICSVRAYRADGRVVTFVQTTAGWQADATVSETLLDGADGGLELRDNAGARERYGMAAAVTGESTAYRLLAVIDAAGIGETLEYDAHGRLLRVVAPFGRALTLSYDDRGRIITLSDPAGARYGYAYDIEGNLDSVIYPDAAPAAGTIGSVRRRYVYDDPFDVSALTGIVDENGARYASWNYDAAGHAISSEHAGGVGRVDFDYRTSYTAVTDARGQTRSFNTALAAGVGLITAVTGANCNVCGPDHRAATTYDARGFKNLVSDAAGTVTDFDHDEHGREIRRVDAVGTPAQRSVERRFDAATQLLSSVELRDAAGRAVWRATQDYWHGLLKRRVEEDLLPGAGGEGVRRTEYSYFGEDAARDPGPLFGLLERVDGPRSDVADITHYEYDELTGELTRVTNALGQVWRFGPHDAHGHALEIVDPNGVRTALHYHPRGWLLSRSVGDAVTRYAYDAAGQLIRLELPDGSFMTYAYDAAHRLVAVSDALGNSLHYTLDAQGNRLREEARDPRGQVRWQVERSYDAFNQLASTLGGEGQVVRYTWDANGWLRTRTMAGGDPDRVEHYAHDARGRLIERHDALGGKSVLAHGPRDELILFSDPTGVTTRMVYDAYAQRTARENPDAGPEHYRHDAAGNRTGVTDARGLTATSSFDALNRVTATNYADGTSVHYRYDEADGGPYARGRLTTRVDGAGTTRYAYDDRGNVVDKALEAGAERYTTHYAYSAADRLVGVTYPSGRLVEYRRDVSGRIASVLTAAAGQAVEVVLDDVEYEPFGPLRAWRHGNGVRMSRTHDRDYRLRGLVYQGILARAYRYDGFDNIVDIQRLDDPTQDEHYAYDALDRLIGYRGPAGERAYGYDANGNRIRYRDAAVDESYRYEPGTNRLDAILDAGGRLLVDYAMDGGGRTVLGPDNYRYVYGADGRLRRLSSRTMNSTLTHDALGAIAYERYTQASRATLRDSQRRYLQDERRQPIVIHGKTRLRGPGIDQTTASVEELIYLDDLPIAWSSAGKLLHLHTDHLGSLIAASRADRGVEHIASIPPFAGQAVNAVSFLGALAYPGQQIIAQAPLLAHNGWREYDRRSGRYLQADPLGLDGGPNPYTYAGNDPIGASDPTGLAVWICSRRSRPGLTLGLGNHAYIWDDRTGATCGMGGAYGSGTTDAHEAGWPGDACRKVPDSDGSEGLIMRCCREHANDGLWLPFVKDCHTAVDDCVSAIGLLNPGAPGGRTHPRCDQLGCR